MAHLIAVLMVQAAWTVAWVAIISDLKRRNMGFAALAVLAYGWAVVYALLGHDYNGVLVAWVGALAVLHLFVAPAIFVGLKVLDMRAERDRKVAVILVRR
jgi:hypothetical protein